MYKLKPHTKIVGDGSRRRNALEIENGNSSGERFSDRLMLLRADYVGAHSSLSNW